MVTSAVRGVARSLLVSLGTTVGNNEVHRLFAETCIGGAATESAAPSDKGKETTCLGRQCYGNALVWHSDIVAVLLPARLVLLRYVKGL